MEEAAEPSSVSSSQESLGPLLECNLPSNYLLPPDCGESDFDRDLAFAARRAKETGSITPVVKHELKCLIQSRRASQGKPELTVDFSRTPVGQLTKAEKERRLRRKEQNRMAARRFRKNRKLQEEKLYEETVMLEAKNEGLVEKIGELNRLKEMLLTRLGGHLLLCPDSHYPYRAPRDSKTLCTAPSTSPSPTPPHPATTTSPTTYGLQLRLPPQGSVS